ncbi:hypothetical protein [Eubacterium callanderi]|uniref:hypothetical protein n=1 Tax=Eubacterium callanderi TaxID=53442 RepID=UPI0022E7D0F2|nr:hypothetical protein [Eubacterium callanderi]
MFWQSSSPALLLWVQLDWRRAKLWSVDHRQIFQLIGEVAKVLASKKIKKVPVVTAKGVLACVVWRFTIMRYIFKLFFSGIDK